MRAREFLSAEAPYLEGGSIIHDGVEYNFDAVMSIAEKLPTKQCSVDELSWILNYDTPNPTRTNKADLSFPLIVSKSVNGKLAVIDGLHRLNLAVRNDVKTLPVKYIPLAELKSARLNEEVNRGVIYTKPDFKREWEEAARYPEFQQLGLAAWIDIAAQGRVVDWSSLDRVGNVELDLDNLDQDKVQRVAVDVKRNHVELPIVGLWADGTADLIAGNTRVATLIAQGHTPKVWAVDVPSDSD